MPDPFYCPHCLALIPELPDSNASARLGEARQALLADGYFKPDEVSDDIAPRIIERLAALRRTIELLGTNRRPQLTAQQKADARKLLKDIGRCEHCGGIHGRACPRLKRIRWDGGKAVEATYWRDGTWPTSDVLFPEDIADDDEEAAP